MNYNVSTLNTIIQLNKFLIINGIKIIYSYNDVNDLTTYIHKTATL